ncbi:MAG: phage integrase N-terminal SAM-like domain-containing protein [Verrucomicrobiota bacterium]
MYVFYFNDWKQRLQDEPLSEQVRKDHFTSIRWYRNFLNREAVPATLSSARTFMERLIEARRPAHTQAQAWKNGLNWYFKSAPIRRTLLSQKHRSLPQSPHSAKRPIPEVSKDRRRCYPTTIREYQQACADNPMIEETVRLMRIRHMSYRTEESYVGWLRRFQNFLQTQGKPDPSEASLKAFLSHLAVEGGVRAGTQRQALNACVFYLREVRGGKGDKDRVLALPRVLVDPLQKHLRQIRSIHERDRQENRPGVYLPDALSRKYARAGQAWTWFWLFPAQSLAVDPRRPGEGKRRHHVMDRVYQRHLSAAATEAQINKRSHSHILRHSFAAHQLEHGTKLPILQKMLGHRKIETTMIYIHLVNDGSDQCDTPLDVL